MLVMPAGIVATTRSQPSRSVGVVIVRVRLEWAKAPMIAFQSLQKKATRASAVPTWSATTKASQNDSGLLSDATRLFQLKRAGNTTAWPRLETGKSSLTP